ncbi:hypothetical protein [Tropicimonas sp. S265A]|uniref:hypothetical protein n=1 Tax=Tropicimonas sp. S265A TaxID=3415134 RepID=UPI003C7AB84F
MAKKLFIHIGAHKTGTTAIQQTCANQARALRDLGVLYPKVNWYHYAQHRLAFALKRSPDPARGDIPDLPVELDALNSAIARARTDKILISSEEFFSAPEPQIRLFAKGLQGATPRIVAFVRRPDAFLMSMYNQKAKHPGNQFCRPITPFIATPDQIDPDIRVHTCLSAWATVFGTEAISLCLYEDGPPLARVLQIMGLPGEAIAPAQRVNPSVPGAVIEAMRLSKLIGMDPDKQKKLYHLAQKEFTKAPPYHVSSRDRRAVLQAMAPETGALFAAFGRENPYEATTCPVPEDPPEAAPNLRMRDLMQLVDRLMA